MQPELVSYLRKANIYNTPQGNGSESRTEAPSAGTLGPGSAHSVLGWLCWLQPLLC